MMLEKYPRRLATLLVITTAVAAVAGGCVNRGEDSRPHYKRVLPMVVSGHGKQGYLKPCCFLGYSETEWHRPEQFGTVKWSGCTSACNQAPAVCPQVISEGSGWENKDTETQPVQLMIGDLPVPPKVSVDAFNSRRTDDKDVDHSEGKDDPVDANFSELLQSKP